MIKPLVILFLLGALQGAVGWIMVASGLTGDAVYVRPTKLAMHFVLAMILLFYTYWFYLQLTVRTESRIGNNAVRNFTWVVIVVLFIQFFWAALMAGHRAAPVAYTWPAMNGSFIPPEAFNRPGGIRSIIEDPFVVHFIHRMLAYLLVILVIILKIKTYGVKATTAFNKARNYPWVLVLVQTTLGILTVITSINIRAYKWNEFEWMAQLHQVVGMLLMLSLVLVLFLSRDRKKLRSM